VEQWYANCSLPGNGKKVFATYEEVPTLQNNRTYKTIWIHESACTCETEVLTAGEARALAADRQYRQRPSQQ
jgi:hypothetical protein